MSTWYIHKYIGCYRESNPAWVRCGMSDDEPAAQQLKWLGFTGAI